MISWFKNKAYKFFRIIWIVILSLILILILTVVIPFLINLMFKIYPKNDTFVAEWTAGDALTFYGTVLTFISTTLLGIVALKLSKYTANVESLERNKISVYIEKNSKLSLQYGRLGNKSYNYSIDFKLHSITNTVPNKVDFISIYYERVNNILNSVSFELKCNHEGFIYAISNNQFSVLANISTDKGLFHLINEKSFSDYRHGKMSKEEFIEDNLLCLHIDCLFYNGKIITPASIVVAAKISDISLNYFKPLESLHILDYNICTSNITFDYPIFEKEYKSRITHKD